MMAALPLNNNYRRGFSGKREKGVALMEVAGSGEATPVGSLMVVVVEHQGGHLCFTWCGVRDESFVSTTTN